MLTHSPRPAAACSPVALRSLIILVSPLANAPTLKAVKKVNMIAMIVIAHFRQGAKCIGFIGDAGLKSTWGGVTICDQRLLRLMTGGIGPTHIVVSSLVRT
jgi:hypothetical protein